YSYINNRWRFPQIICSWLESEPQYSHCQSFQGTIVLSCLFNQFQFLVIIDLYRSFDGLKLLVIIITQPMKRLCVFWKAGTAISDACFQKFISNSLVHSHSPGHLFYLRTYSLVTMRFL